MEFVLAASNSSQPPIHLGWTIAGVGVVVSVLIGVGALLFKGGNWYGQVNTERGHFKDFMEKVDKKLDQILERIRPLEATTGSPLRLTDLGNKIAQEIEAEQWTEELLRCR